MRYTCAVRSIYAKTVIKISICSSNLLNYIDFIHFLVYSFVELRKTLLEIDGVMYILSDKFNQDLLEEHFVRQRMKVAESIIPLSKIIGITRGK